jgi:hypothetical protein
VRPDVAQWTRYLAVPCGRWRNTADGTPHLQLVTPVDLAAAMGHPWVRIDAYVFKSCQALTKSANASSRVEYKATISSIPINLSGRLVAGPSATTANRAENVISR